MTNQPYCRDADNLRRKSHDLLQESKTTAQRAMRLEGMAYDTEMTVLDHCRECPTCQGKEVPQPLEPLLGVV